MTTEEKSGTQETSQANGATADAKDDNKGGQESENQENAIDDDFIVGLDIVDVWDEEEKDKPRRRSWDRSRGKEKRVSREREKERDRDRDRDRNRRRSRSRGRRSRSRGRRSRSNERRRELARRDPSKSNKDIEQDKLRAKKDNDSKILAEKEKAIKTLLDSDNVLPPGTETEAIQTIVEKNQQEQEIRNQEDRNRVSRKRSPIHSRLGPKKVNSKSPIRLSPLRRERRSPFSPGRRRRSIDRDTSIERRIASRRRLREREGRLGRRSRSRDRHRSRSRSYDRRRSRSQDRTRRLSRSPFDSRHSPRRTRRRSLSRSRSPNRSQRRRSPFINELARQFHTDNILPDNNAMGAAPVGAQAVPPGFVPMAPMDPRMGPTPLMPGPPHMMAPMDMHPAAPVMHPGMQPAGPPFMGYDGPAGPPFDPMSRGPAPLDYPNMYNPSMMNPMRPVSPVPQPVPAPVMAQGSYVPPIGVAQQHLPLNAHSGAKYSPNASYSNRHSHSPDRMFRNMGRHEERMKTPEPPIISESKQNEKTSLSSLLEASVSTKDVSGLTATFKGFRPEILRHCERALRSLPVEDPRLNMKGRFFFDPLKKGEPKAQPATGSNSILLRKGRSEIHWDEERDRLSNGDQPQSQQQSRRMISHQKYCQTEETMRQSVAVQAEEEPKPKADFSQQVGPHDLAPPKEELRRGAAMILEENRRAALMEDNRRAPMMDDTRRAPLMDDNRRAVENKLRQPMEDSRRAVDRLDWSMRETYDHGADRLRDNEDLRWNPNANAAVSGGGVGAGVARPNERSQWTRGFSPQPIDHMHGNVAPANNPVDGYMRGERDNNLRDRDMDHRMDMRVMEMMRGRERLMGEARGGLGIANRPVAIDEFSTRRQQPVDDYDMRKGFGGSSGGPGSVGSFNRAMEMMEMERNEQQQQQRGGPSPMEEPDELEIIEERGSWQPRAPAPAAAQYANARGNNNINRSFRGRVGGYRNY